MFGITRTKDFPSFFFLLWAMFSNIKTNLLLLDTSESKAFDPWTFCPTRIAPQACLVYQNGSEMGYSCRLHIHLRGKNERSSRTKFRANELKVIQWNLVVTRRFLTPRAVMLWDSLLGKEKGPKNLCWLTQSLDVSASPFQFSIPLVFPCWLVWRLVN